MERTINTVFGLGDQNNSGGYFIQNDDVDIYVAVEGLDKEDAINKFQDIVSDHSSFCNCCGRRWSGIDFENWGEEIYTINDFVEASDNYNCILHLIDGTKKKVRYEQ